MNLVDTVVEEVLAGPYESYGFWCVPVMANSWGAKFQTTVYVKTIEEADAVDVGYTWLT